MISQVDEGQLDEVWPLLLPMVVRGLSHGQGDSLAPCDMLKSLRSGDMILWVAHEGTTLFGGIVFSVVQHPRKKSVVVIMAAGVNFDEWVNEICDLLKVYAEGIGADCVEAMCRPGMAKKLAAAGWKQKSVVMEMI